MEKSCFHGVFSTIPLNLKLQALSFFVLGEVCSLYNVTKPTHKSYGKSLYKTASPFSLQLPVREEVYCDLGCTTPQITVDCLLSKTPTLCWTWCALLRVKKKKVKGD